MHILGNYQHLYITIQWCHLTAVEGH